MVTSQMTFLAIAISVAIVSASDSVNAGPPSWLEPLRTKEDVERVEAALRTQGLVKYNNGNWGPPLPPGVFMKQDTFPPPVVRKRGPGHRGNVILFAETVVARPNGAETLLKSSKASAKRLAYFHELLEHPAYQLDGWSLSIRSVESVDGTDRLTIYSTPLVTCERLGPCVFILGWYEETYELKDGKLTLVKTAAVGDRPIMGIVGM